MGGLKDSEYDALSAMRDMQTRRQHGWATDADGIELKIVERLRTAALCEVADLSTVTTLPGPPQWAARLTPEGHDALVYLPARRSGIPGVAPTTDRPAGVREVKLRPKAMEVLRLYLSLGHRLRQPPAPGLEEAVRTAQRDDRDSAWVLQVTEPQLASIAYAMWLEAHAHNVAAANRLAREHDARYQPSTAAPS
ncbi:DUF6417 family protein [Streptomyces sp. NPDC049555]|uniref:DUF6417 family protein n=1 Tax=Streptomyces sp. NPDC049555 TaxID=3154930 RepID=UPI00341C1D9C